MNHVNIIITVKPIKSDLLNGKIGSRLRKIVYKVNMGGLATNLSL